MEGTSHDGDIDEHARTIVSRIHDWFLVPAFIEYTGPINIMHRIRAHDFVTMYNPTMRVATFSTDRDLKRTMLGGCTYKVAFYTTPAPVSFEGTCIHKKYASSQSGSNLYDRILLTCEYWYTRTFDADARVARYCALAKIHDVKIHSNVAQWLVTQALSLPDATYDVDIQWGVICPYMRKEDVSMCDDIGWLFPTWVFPNDNQKDGRIWLRILMLIGLYGDCLCDSMVQDGMLFDATRLCKCVRLLGTTPYQVYTNFRDPGANVAFWVHFITDNLNRVDTRAISIAQQYAACTTYIQECMYSDDPKSFDPGVVAGILGIHDRPHEEGAATD